MQPVQQVTGIRPFANTGAAMCMVHMVHAMRGGTIPQGTRLPTGVVSRETCCHCARWATGISPSAVIPGESTVPVVQHKTAKNKLNVITGIYMTK